MTFKIEKRQVERNVEIYRCDRLGCAAEAIASAAAGWMECGLLEIQPDLIRGGKTLGTGRLEARQFLCPAHTQEMIAAMNAPAPAPAIPTKAKFVVAMDDTTGKSVVAEVPPGKTTGEVAMTALLASLEAHLLAEGGLFTIKDFELVEAGGGWLNVVPLSDPAAETLARWQKAGGVRA